MVTEAHDGAGLTAKALAALNQARYGTDTPADLWASLLDAMAELVGAEHGLLLLHAADEDTWKRVASWPAGAPQSAVPRTFLNVASGLAAEAVQAESAQRALDDDGGTALAVRVELDEAQQTCVAAFRVPGTPDDIDSLLARLLLVRDTPALFQVRRKLGQAQQDVDHVSSVLDLITAMGEPSKFRATAMVFCNELAGRHACDRVGLGWFERSEAMRLQVLSHTERFERKMDAVKLLEFAMEEALDQDDELVLPTPEDNQLVVADSEAYAKQFEIPYLCSVPIRVEGDPVGVVTCERRSAEFNPSDLRLLRLSCDLAARRLDDLKRRDRWIGARAARGLRDLLGKFLGVERTWIKVLSIAICVALGVLCFGRKLYRVEAPFMLRSDDMLHLSAPFDGYIADVKVRIGDEVAAQQPLLTLDTRELLLESASAEADHMRYQREAEKARAENSLADMQIALAQAEQVKARLGLVRQRLAQSNIHADFPGVVVSGDLKERIGFPVSKGEELFRISRAGAMYVEAEVSEKDIHDVQVDQLGEVAFASEPRLHFPVRIARVHPSGQVRDGENVFIVRCEFVGEVQPWWRSGMSGISKLNAGRRNLLWIFTHKTVDFLRLRLWW